MPSTPIEVGIASHGPKLATGILVIYADEESFTFMTPEGHMFAGMITFSAEDVQGRTEVRISILLRCNDPLYELGWPVMKRGGGPVLGRDVLRNLATALGVPATCRSSTSMRRPQAAVAQLAQRPPQRRDPVGLAHGHQPVHLGEALTGRSDHGAAGAQRRGVRLHCCGWPCPGGPDGLLLITSMAFLAINAEVIGWNSAAFATGGVPLMLPCVAFAVRRSRSSPPDARAMRSAGSCSASAVALVRPCPVVATPSGPRWCGPGPSAERAAEWVGAGCGCSCR